MARKTAHRSGNGVELRPAILLAVFISLLLVWQFKTVNELQDDQMAIVVRHAPTSVSSLAAGSGSNAENISAQHSGAALHAGSQNEGKEVTGNLTHHQETLMPSNARSAEANAMPTPVPDIVNTIPSEDRIIEGIKKQLAMRQRVAKAVDERKKQIDLVHQAILASGALSSTNQNKVLTPANLNAPADLLEKVKSHQLTAH